MDMFEKKNSTVLQRALGPHMIINIGVSGVCHWSCPTHMYTYIQKFSKRGEIFNMPPFPSKFFGVTKNLQTGIKN